MKILRILAIFFILTGCNQSPEENSTKDQTLKVGVIAGPEAQLMEVALNEAKEKFGISTQLIQFQDYISPNIALADGSLDVNAFQHLPYLNEMVKNKGLPLVAVAKTFLYPLGAYSNKITNIDQLKNGDTVTIPNDPTNEGRALHILAEANLIKLAKPNELLITPYDISDNPKKLKFVPMEANQLVRSLDDANLAVINSTFAVNAGFIPNKDALILERKSSAYTNIFVCRENNKDDPRIAKLIEAFHSQPVLDEALKLFKGGAIKGW